MKQYKLRALDFKLTNGTHLGVEKKVEELSPEFHDGAVFDFCIKKEDEGYKCDLKVHHSDDFLRGEEYGKTVEIAIDNAVSTLLNRARNTRKARIDKKRKNLYVSKQEYVHERDIADVSLDSIIRRKEHDIQLMSEGDAIIDIESSGHSFYVFKNTDNEDKLSVLYKRLQGYGLMTVE